MSRQVGGVRSLVAVAVAAACLVPASRTRAQGLPDYPAESQLLVETPGTTRSIAGGFFNPASWGIQPAGGLYFSWDDGNADPDSGGWAGLVSLRNLAFGVRQFDFERAGDEQYRIRDYTLGLAGGNRTHAWGIAYAWGRGDLDRLQRHERITGGSILRCRYGSVGLASLWDLEQRDNHVQLDLGVRPIGPRATLFADAVYEHGQNFDDIATGYGIELWPLRGLAIAAKARSTGELSLRAAIGINRHTGFSYRSHLDDGGERAASTYAFEAGAERAVARDIFRPRPRRFPEFALRGATAYQRYRWFDQRRTLQGTLATWDELATDPTVGGVVVNLSRSRLSAEMAWELRDQLAGMRARGKKVLVYIDEASMYQYALASVADEVWLDPSGVIDLRGLAAGRTYMRRALDKAGIGVDEWRFFTYKSAFEGYSRDSMSDPDREQRQALVDDFYEVIAGAMASARGMSREQLDGIVNRQGVLLAGEALGLGLVDSLGDFRAVQERAERASRRATPDESRAVLGEIAGDPDWRSEEWGQPPRIAVLYGIGPCAMDSGIRGPVLAKAIRTAAGDRSVKAIVLRVDSPGGEILPSDLVAREVKAATERKPVLVSQGQVAASGGYWMSMDADTIVASPLTITGSIGVIGGWVWNKTFGEKLGLDYDGVKRGEHSDALNGVTLPFVNQTLPDRPLTAEERDRAEFVIRTLYRDFVRKVAAGRGLDEQRVDALGQGRVYSGGRGRQVGLVDELGGLWTTIRLAKRAAGIPAERAVELQSGPGAGAVDLDFLRPRLLQWLARQPTEQPEPLASTVTLQGIPLRAAEVEFVRMLVRGNGKPLVIVEPIEVLDGSHDR